MTHRLVTNCAKNYCNRTLIVKVIVENVVTCFLWDTVYIQLCCTARPTEIDEKSSVTFTVRQLIGNSIRISLPVIIVIS